MGKVTFFDDLGFYWDRSTIPANAHAQPIERVCALFERLMPQFVWDMSVLEGNPLTLAEVKILLNGKTIDGRRAADQEQVLRLGEASKYLVLLVKGGHFQFDKPTFCSLNNITVSNEALEWGHFRGEGQETNYTPSVGLGKHGCYKALPTIPDAPKLNGVFKNGIKALETCTPFERGCAFFLFGALQQFFFDGNKRTSRFMMNGVLMSAGIDAITVPAVQVHEFNEQMVRFYISKDATEMFQFLIAMQYTFRVNLLVFHSLGIL